MGCKRPRLLKPTHMRIFHHGYRMLNCEKSGGACGNFNNPMAIVEPEVTLLHTSVAVLPHYDMKMLVTSWIQRHNASVRHLEMCFGAHTSGFMYSIMDMKTCYITPNIIPSRDNNNITSKRLLWPLTLSPNHTVWEGTTNITIIVYIHTYFSSSLYHVMSAKTSTKLEK